MYKSVVVDTCLQMDIFTACHIPYEYNSVHRCKDYRVGIHVDTKGTFTFADRVVPGTTQGLSFVRAI